MIPAGLLVTVPAPKPLLFTVRVRWTVAVKVALTVRSAVMVTVHWMPFTESQPAQPVKDEPELAKAVKVTEVESLNCAEQAAPQLIPSGLLVTVPVPVPALVTVRVRWTGATAVKVTVTVRFAVMLTVHWLPLSESQPAQLPNEEPEPATAVKVTEVESAN